MKAQYTRTKHRMDRPKERRGASVTATEAKNAFGRILENAIRGDRIFITKHRHAKAVLISVEEFDSLSVSTTDKLDTLSDEFDAMLTRMQSPGARTGLKAAFAASPKRLGKAALRAVQKRG